jgi:HTH-type transcriptional regulator/antitoxin HigA
MTQAELARRAELTTKHVSQIVTGDASISPAVALRLERVLGIPSHFWAALEANYQTQKQRLDERARLRSEISWLDSFPVRELLSRGILRQAAEKVSLVEQLLTFFGVSSIDAWRREWESPHAVFRKSNSSPSREGAIATWLRIGEIEARARSTAPFDLGNFRSALLKARELTEESPETFIPALRDLGASGGVAVVFVRELPGAPVYGATRWLAPSKAMVALSLRYKSNDQFWFSFFHECGHILKHSKLGGFIDTPGRDGDDDRETEANRWAADFLVPPAQASRLGSLKSRRAVIAFAREIGVHPGIVVGRMQHEGHISHTMMNALKVKLEWEAVDRASA